MKLFVQALLFFIFTSIKAQECSKQLTIYGSKTNGLFTTSVLASYGTTNSDSSQAEIVSSAWTCNSLGFPTCNFRTLLRYKVTQIPQNAVITSAKLYLFAKTNAVNGNSGSPTYGTANTSLLQKVTQAWQPAVPGWNNQPATTTTNQKILPQSTSSAQNYVVDVTDFVQSWVADSTTNFGMLVRLQNEQYYNSMIFNSGQAVQSLQPRLEISYTFPSNVSYTVYGAKTNGLFTSSVLASYSANSSDSNQVEIVSSAWTCNSLGYPTCNFRTLLKYKLTAIPSAAVVNSAKLYLFAKTNAVNGNPGSPTDGSANTSLLQKVTQPWQPGVPGWNTQPAVDISNQKILPQSTSTAQNYVVDVTDFVQSWVSDSANNNGMLIRLLNEQYYNSMIFNSGQAADSLKPRLEICYSYSTTLPLRLTSFQGNSVDTRNLITWSTVNETDLKEIDLERSIDGRSFITLNTFKPAEKAENHYSYEDLKLEPSTKYFYRLKLSAKDGTVNFSQVIVLTAKKDARLVILPNPAHDFIQLTVTSEMAEYANIRIVTSEGKLIHQQRTFLKSGVNNLIIDKMKEWSRGTYFILLNSNKNTVNKSFILR